MSARDRQVTQPHLDLQAPPPLPEGGLRVMALGGLGEIGRNMAVLEFDGRLLVIDCGVLFPEAEQPGVDLILPDFGVIEHRLDDIDAVVLTHGHEDHIGAVPVPAAACAATSRWSARGSPSRWSRPSCASTAIDPTLVEVAAGDDHVAGPVPLRVHRRSTTRSPTRSRSPCTRRPARSCTPATSRWTSCRWTASSPTSAPSPGSGSAASTCCCRTRPTPRCPASSPPSASIGPVLDDVFAPGHPAADRLQLRQPRAPHPAGARLRAETHGRKVAFVGRSMVRNMGVARDLGLLHVAPGLMVSLDEAAAMPPEQVVLVSTGSQGEPLSALGRMARGEHHQVTIEAGDTVVLASSLVPGQRDRRLQGDQRAGPAGRHGRAQGDGAGARLRARAGRRAAHPAQRGQAALPDAGARRVAAPARARRAGRGDRHDARDRVLLAEDGVVVDLVDGKASIVGSVPIGNVYVDGLNVGDVGEESLQARRILGDEGFVALTVVIELVDPHDRARPAPVHPRVLRRPGRLRRRRCRWSRTTSSGPLRGRRGRPAPALAGRSAGRSASGCRDTYRRRPMIIPTVLEV